MAGVTKPFVASILILIAGGTFSMVLRHPPNTAISAIDLHSIPLDLDGWTGKEIPLDPETLRLLDLSQYAYREYVDDSGFSLWLFVGYFTSQRFGSSVHSPRNCLPGSGWEIVNRSYSPLPGDSSLTVNRMDISRGDFRQVMYYWFETRAGSLNNEFSLKGDLVISSIMRRPTDAAFIRVTVPAVGYDPDAVKRKVAEFVRIFKKEIHSALPF